jgi:hypothetical protein
VAIPLGGQRRWKVKEAGEMVCDIHHGPSATERQHLPVHIIQVSEESMDVRPFIEQEVP